MVIFNNRFRNTIKKGDGRNLLSNFISLILLQVAGYVFPLLTIPYLAHVIGVNYYGEIAFAMAIMIYFQTIVDYGFVFSAVRDVARCRDDFQQVSAIYSKVMYARWLLVFVSFILMIILILVIPKLFEMRLVLLASFLMVIGHAMFPDWMFQALERMKYITIFNVLVKLIFTLAVFAFIKKPSDYLFQPIFTSVGYVVCGIGSMWLINRWGIKLIRPRFIEVFRSIKSNTDLFINQIVPNLYNSASVLMLGFFHGDAANGIFDAANRFNNAGTSFFSIISRTFYPFLSRRFDKHSFFKKINIFTATVIALLLFLGSPFIVHTLFPAEFDGAILVLRIISISLIFLAISNVYGTNYLIINGYEKEIRKITLWSSIIGLIMGIVMVYCYSYIGVAITITFSRGLMGCWCMYKAVKIEKTVKITNKSI